MNEYQNLDNIMGIIYHKPYRMGPPIDSVQLPEKSGWKNYGVYGRYNEPVHVGYIGKPTQWEFQDKMEVRVYVPYFKPYFVVIFPEI